MPVATNLVISVAVCTYNGEAYLKEQLESIAGQSRVPDAVVIVDDGSQDATCMIVKQFAEEVKFPVRLEINQQQLGVTKNFERAIAACSGDIIVLADQDDVWRYDKMETLCRMFEEYPDVALVFSDAELVDDKLAPLGYTLWQSLGFGRAEQRMMQCGHALTVLLRRNVIAGATMAFRASFRSFCLPIAPAWRHDAWIACLLASVSNIALTEQLLIRYRQHDHNVCGATKQDSSLLEKMITARGIVSQGYLDKADHYRHLERILTQSGDYNTVQSRHKIDACIRHLSIRALLADTDMPLGGRCASIVSEVMNRNYFHYSDGWRSVIKDMIGYRAFRRLK